MTNYCARRHSLTRTVASKTVHALNQTGDAEQGRRNTGLPTEHARAGGAGHGGSRAPQKAGAADPRRSSAAGAELSSGRTLGDIPPAAHVLTNRLIFKLRWTFWWWWWGGFLVPENRTIRIRTRRYLEISDR